MLVARDIISGDNPLMSQSSPMAALLFDDITEGLELVKCPNLPPDTPSLKSMLGGKTCSKMYCKIVVWLSDQMSGAMEAVSLPTSPDEEPLFRY